MVVEFHHPIKMLYQTFARFTCQYTLSIDIEERILCFFETKNMRFLKNERQFVDNYPRIRSFHLKICQSETHITRFCKNKVVSSTNNCGSKIRNKNGGLLI